MNINNGNGAAGNNIGNFLTISNCFIRGSGDDGLALNSGNSPGCVQMTNTTVINCTSVAPWWANNLGIYGGVNILVSNNLCSDSITEFGMSVGEFGSSGLPLQSGTVISNVIIRGGCFSSQTALRIGQTHTIANVLVAGNIISNAAFVGMDVDLISSNVTVQYNSVISPNLNGIKIVSGAVGAAIIYSNTVTGLNSGKSAFANSSSTFVVITPKAAASYNSQSGITTESCLEGGQDVTGIVNGDSTSYNSINLTGVNAFVARAASAGFGGNIEVHLDSVGGTLVGTCPVVGTGGTQTYANTYCKITGASGTHTIYLVYTGGAGSLFNLEYFGFFNSPPAASHQLVPGNTYSLKALVNNKYVTAPNNGASSLIASSTSVGTAESFKIIDAGGGNIGFQSLINNSNVTAESGGSAPLIANRGSVGAWETFTEVDAGNGNIGLLANADGKYVTAANNGASPLIASSTMVGTNESFIVGFVSGVPPAAPAGLTASPASSQVTLSWATSLGATAYNLKYSTTNGGAYVGVVSNLTSTTYTQTGLTNGVIYYYVVSALNPAGESTNSLPASAIPGVIDRTGWIATASVGGSPGNAIDGNPATRWATGTSQASGQWFQVDMGSANTFYKIVLDATASPGDYPRGYQVNISNDGANWGSPIATGTGSAAVTTITFPTNSARYIRVTQTLSGQTGNYWSIHEFYVYGVGGTVPAAPLGLTATAGNGLVGLTWTGASGVTGYNVKRSTTNGGPYALVVSNLTALVYHQHRPAQQCNLLLCDFRLELRG